MDVVCHPIMCETSTLNDTVGYAITYFEVVSFFITPKDRTLTLPQSKFQLVASQDTQCCCKKCLPNIKPLSIHKPVQHTHDPFFGSACRDIVCCRRVSLAMRCSVRWALFTLNGNSKSDFRILSPGCCVRSLKFQKETASLLDARLRWRIAIRNT